MNILGINAYHGDVSAVLVRDGELVAAVEEERFRRIKHVARISARGDPRLPRDGRDHAARTSSTSASRAIRARIWSRKGLFALRHRPKSSMLIRIARRTTSTSARFRRRSPTRSASAPAIASRRCTGSSIIRRTWRARSSCRRSSDAAVCAIDGFGDFVSTSWAMGQGSSLDVIHRTLLSALARRALSGDHAVPRLPEVRRRVQGHGPCAVRDAGVRRGNSQTGAAPAGRALRTRPVVLQALVGRRRHDVGRR